MKNTHTSKVKNSTNRTKNSTTDMRNVTDQGDMRDINNKSGKNQKFNMTNSDY